VLVCRTRPAGCDFAAVVGPGLAADALLWEASWEKKDPLQVQHRER
jgi:hypothetical protein